MYSRLTGVYWRLNCLVYIAELLIELFISFFFVFNCLVLVVVYCEQYT